MYFLMFFQLFVGVLCLSLFWYLLLCVHTSVSLEEEERANCFAFINLHMSFYFKCSVALPHGAVGWSAVCDCGTS